ncbi:MAG: heme exporter protein CcmD [Pseudomonadota bacterium]
MSYLSDPHAGYVITAYAATAVILGIAIWATLSANARARKDLEDRE